MTRAVVSVATGPYVKGQARLRGMGQHIGNAEMCFFDYEPALSPKHSERPYAFKAYALKCAAEAGATTLLWCDACILPVRSLEPLWERIERDGYWFSRNGYTNYEWTADSAYPDLFPECFTRGRDDGFDEARETNRKIPHVVATAFGLNVRHPKGRAFLDEYYRLASETRAFCGPWINEKHARASMPGVDLSQAIASGRIGVCGEVDVRGHRHDQTAASVIAWRLGFELTSPPDIFAYGKAGDATDERTILLADGSY